MLLTEKDRTKIFQHPFFSGLDVEKTASIFESYACRVRSYDEGEEILSPTSGERTMGLILSGRAAVTTKDSTRRTLLRFLREGDLFGVSNLFSDEPFSTHIKAEKKCRVFLLPREAVRALLASDPVFLNRHLEFLCGRICFLNRKIGYLTAGSAERRLALYLSSFEKREIVLENSLSSLSDLLDVGRASLYRAFDRLIEDGYLQKEGRRIVLTNPEAMLNAYQ